MKRYQTRITNTKPILKNYWTCLQHHPLVVPVGEISHHTQDGNVDWEHLRQILPPPQPGPPGTTSVWTMTVTQEIILQKIGDGVAFNVHSILYVPYQPLGNQYIFWNNEPIQGKSEYQLAS